MPTWEPTSPAFKTREITDCTLNTCLLRVFISTAPAIHSAGMHLGVILSFRCHCLSPAAANNIRNVGAHISHSEAMSVQLNADSSDLLFFLSVDRSLELTNDTHSLWIKLPISLTIALARSGWFSTALQNARYLFQARLLPIAANFSSNVASSERFPCVTNYNLSGEKQWGQFIPSNLLLFSSLPSRAVSL